MRTTSSWPSRRKGVTGWAVALGFALSITACQTPAEQAGPAACLANSPEAVDWTAQASSRAVTFDVLLADVVAREGRWKACRGELHSLGDQGTGFGRLTYSFASGLTLTIESLPPESSVVTLRREAGLLTEADWVGMLKRYAAARGVPIDWSRPIVVKRTEGAATLRYEAAETGWNASAVIERGATGQLTGLSLSVAL